MLEHSGPAKVIRKLRAFARGCRAKVVNKEIAYLVGHLEAGRLRYFELREAKVPICPGVVDSAVRRVINLRFKSVSQCWYEDRLEHLMYLPAILKNGRWDDVVEALLLLLGILKINVSDVLFRYPLSLRLPVVASSETT